MDESHASQGWDLVFSLSSEIHLQLKWHWGGHSAYIMLIVSPLPPSCPSALRFMLLFHVLSRICGICNTSKWRMVSICLNPVWIDSFSNEGYSKWQKASLRFHSHDFGVHSKWWRSYRFINNINAFILISLSRLFHLGLKCTDGLR